MSVSLVPEKDTSAHEATTYNSVKNADSVLPGQL